MGLFFARLNEKHNLLESFEKNCESFHKTIAKSTLFLHISLKELTNNVLIFCAFWTKNANCWEILRKFWKFLMKILLKYWIFILILFFENFLVKIEPSEITPVFYNNFFGLGDFPPFSPGYAHDTYHIFPSCWGAHVFLRIVSPNLVVILWIRANGFSLEINDFCDAFEFLAI